MNEMYFEFAKNVKRKLQDEINGGIKFEIFESIDTIIFRIRFKDFNYQHAVGDVQSSIYEGKTEELVSEIMESYRREVLRGFFKSGSKKKSNDGGYKRSYTKFKKGLYA